MRKRLFVTEAQDLISLVEGSIFNNTNHQLEISVEELTNYWVNDLMRASGKFPMANINRYLDKVQTYCTLTAEEMVTFKEILFHTIEGFDFDEMGSVVRHDIRGGNLEFYILRG